MGDIGYNSKSLGLLCDEIEGSKKSIELEDKVTDVLIVYEFEGYKKVYFNKKCQKTKWEDYYLNKTKRE